MYEPSEDQVRSHNRYVQGIKGMSEHEAMLALHQATCYVCLYNKWKEDQVKQANKPRKRRCSCKRALVERADGVWICNYCNPPEAEARPPKPVTKGRSLL